MSIIVAIKDKDTIYLGADSLSTAGQLKYSYTKCPSNFKVMKFNDILIGNVGLVCVKQIWAREAKKIFKDITGETLTKEFIVKNVVPVMRKNMIEDGAIKNENDNENVNIIASRDKLFYIDEDFGVYNIDTNIAIGSGRQYSYTYLLDESLPIRDRLLKSIKSATNFVNTVDLPAILIDTKNMKYEIVEEVD